MKAPIIIYYNNNYITEIKEEGLDYILYNKTLIAIRKHRNHCVIIFI